MNKKINLILLFFTFSFFACSTMSKNFIRTSSTSIKGGVAGESQWSDALEFDRYSWYNELTLLFDLWLAPIDKQSPFVQWLSEDERNELDSCPEAKVAISYSLDNERISKKMFEQQLEDQDYQVRQIPTFHTYLKLHPNYLQHSLNLYDSYLICSAKLNSSQNLKVSFPSFRQIELK